MTIVNGGFLHYTDMKKFLKNLLRNCWSDPFQNLFAKFGSVHKHGSGEWGFLHYTDMNKFLKNLFL